MKKFITTIFITIIAFSFCNAQEQKAKYIFLFIGDGMGVAHVSATEAYLAGKDGKIGSENLSFSNFPYTGFATTYSANNFATCSSAAGTALSTGYKTNNGMLGVAPDSSNLTSITYKLKNHGYKIGVATNVSVDHATPAAFYANLIKRTAYYEAACQLSTTGFEFFAGGDFYYPKGKTKDKTSVYDISRDNGYTIVRGVEGVNNVSNETDKLIAFFAKEGTTANLPYAIDRKEGDAKLADIVESAIKFLTPRSDKGFFVMVEGGQIDWVAHNHDAAGTIKEVIDFSDAVQIAFDFYKKYPNETLIVVTADHETGGMALGITNDSKISGVKKQSFANIDGQPVSAGLLDKERGRAMCDSINMASSIGFTTKGHTGIVVPVYAIGAGAELFTGKLDNTDIPRRIMKAAGAEF